MIKKRRKDEDHMASNWFKKGRKLHNRYEMEM